MKKNKKNRKNKRKNNNYKNKHQEIFITDIEGIDCNDFDDLGYMVVLVEDTDYVNFKSESIEKVLNNIEKNKLYDTYVSLMFPVRNEHLFNFKKYLKKLLMDHPELMHYTLSHNGEHSPDVIRLENSCLFLNLNPKLMFRFISEDMNMQEALEYINEATLRLEKYLLKINFTREQIDEEIDYKLFS